MVCVGEVKGKDLRRRRGRENKRNGRKWTRQTGNGVGVALTEETDIANQSQKEMLAH